MRRVPTVLCLTMAAAGFLVHAQEKKDDQQRPPTFRTGAHFVAVDAYPTQDGKAVTGLTINDFELFEHGKPQVIDRVEFIEHPELTPLAERRDPIRSARDSRWRRTQVPRLRALPRRLARRFLRRSPRGAADYRPAQPDDGAAGYVRSDDAVPHHQGPAARPVDVVDSGAAGEIPLLGYREHAVPSRGTRARHGVFNRTDSHQTARQGLHRPRSAGRAAGCAARRAQEHHLLLRHAPLAATRLQDHRVRWGPA